MKETKIFNGKRYRLDSVYRYGDARRAAEWHRKHGRRARIVKAGGEYDWAVYFKE